MAKKRITEQPIPKEQKNNIPKLEITGERQQDLNIFLSSGDIDFGILLLEHYVPKNESLIRYCKFKRDKNYITINLKAILYARN